MRYLVVRALLFLAPFIVLMMARVQWPLALIVSLAFAFAASIVFFPQLRRAAAHDLQRIREGRKRDGAGPDDADVEDAALGEHQHDRTDEPDEPDASARP